MKYLFIVTCLWCIAGQITAQKTSLKPTIGISESLENDSILTAAGYSGIIESIDRRISPGKVSDSLFQRNLVLFKNLHTPIYAFNLFIPGDLKLVGPEVNENAVLQYVESVFQRISRTDTRMIVWGSGGARRIPDGFDRKTAERQFVAIAKKIATLAGKYHILLALENLNSTETNFITTVQEALSIVKQVHHPNLRLNADIYHMLKEGEAPAILSKTKKYLVHVEIAEKEDRTAPGVAGTDFRPYLRELKKLGYHRKIVIEGRWKNVSDIAVPALQYLQNQIDEVYSQ